MPESGTVNKDVDSLWLSLRVLTDYRSEAKKLVIL